MRYEQNSYQEYEITIRTLETNHADPNVILELALGAGDRKRAREFMFVARALEREKGYNSGATNL